ncbi:Type I restriction modification DNA specificity domain protein [compost metagenome]
MLREDKTTVVPKLRFPKFRGITEWKSKRMDMLYSFKRNNTLSRDKLNYERGIVKNIHYGDIHTQFSTLFDITKERTPYINCTETLPAADSDDYCVKGDIIFADASEDMKDVGKAIEIVRLDGQQLLAGQHTILARQNNDELVVGFGGYVFRSALVRSQIQKEAQGTKVYAISPTRLARIKIAYPGDKGEQQKIADCLMSLDELIAAQRQKIDSLRTYKRSLMEQIFPREGETLPRLRFSEFRDAPEWEKVKAGNLFANRTERGDASLPIYSVTMTEGLVKRTSLNRRIDDIAEATGNKKVYRFDISYNMMRMWQGACGIAYEDCMVSPAYVVLSPQSNVHSPFYGYLFKLPHMLQLFTSHSRGLTEDRLRLYYQDFSSIPLPQPDIKEQEQIANCLIALDARIIAESEGMAVLQSHKSGLIQQLFPSLERD